MRTLSKLTPLALMLWGSAHAVCDFDIDVADALTFSQTEIVVESSCKSVTINLTHTGQLPAVAMGHNWVLTTSDDVSAVANEGLAAGFDNNWVTPDDERVIANTTLIGGGETDTISFTTDALQAGEDYTFFCSAPGHWQAMQGKLIFK